MWKGWGTTYFVPMSHLKHLFHLPGNYGEDS